MTKINPPKYDGRQSTWGTRKLPAGILKTKKSSNPPKRAIKWREDIIFNDFQPRKHLQVQSRDIEHTEAFVSAFRKRRDLRVALLSLPDETIISQIIDPNKNHRNGFVMNIALFAAISSSEKIKTSFTYARRRICRDNLVQSYFINVTKEALANAFTNGILCTSCNRVHTIDSEPMRTPINNTQRRKLLAEIPYCGHNKMLTLLPPSFQNGVDSEFEYNWENLTLFPNAIRFSHLQLAVKNWRLGEFAHQDVHLTRDIRSTVQSSYNRGEYMVLTTPFFHKKKDRLLVQTQHWLTVHPEYQNIGGRLVQPSKNVFAKAAANVGLRTFCEHMRKRNLPQNLHEIGYGRCEKCRCEWDYRQLDSLAYKDDFTGKEKVFGQAYVLTFWRDLGKCESINDPTFRAHFRKLEEEEVGEREGEWLGKWDRAWNHYGQGEIMRLFEDEGVYDPRGSLAWCKLKELFIVGDDESESESGEE